MHGSATDVKKKDAASLRKFGMRLVGDVPWGTHLCQFYATKEDLIDILVPYFAEGLRNNEFCMWVTSPPLEVEEAKQALRKAVPELDLHIQKGQIEFLTYMDWYLLGGVFDLDRILQGWVQKEKAALERGFDGLRLTGNTFWLERNNWKAFTDYEEKVNNTINRYKMIAVCTYSLDKCNANEVIDVVKNHQFALIKRLGKWGFIESSETKEIRSALLKSETKFSALYSSMIEGVAFHEVVYDSSGKAVDYIITDVNSSYEKITGLTRNQAIGKKASVLYGTGEPPYLDIYAKVAFSGKPVSFETYFPPMQKHFSISVSSPAKGKFITIFHDITERKKSEERLVHLNVVLKAIRDVNQLIAREKERDKLLKEVCNKLVENLGYYNVWISLFDESGKFVSAAESGLDEDFLPLVEHFKKGKLTNCALKALKQSEIVVIENPPTDCGDCPLAKMYQGRGGLSARIEHLGSVYGLVTASTMKSCIQYREEQDLFKELAGDLAFALYSIRLEEDRKKVEQALQQAKRDWERTFDSVPDLIAIIDNQHRIVRANRAMANRLGTTPEQCAGLYCFKCVHGTYIPPGFCPHIQTLQDGQEHTAEVQEDHLGGYFLVSTTPIVDERGKMIGSVHVARDITERRKMEQTLREREIDLNHAQAVAKIGSWRLDLQRNVLLWSDETYRIFGIPKGTPMTYEAFINIVHPEDRKYVDQKWNAALRGELYDIEHRIVVNGEVKWVREKAELEFDKNGLLLGGFGTVQDITERKRTEQELSDTLRESQLRQAEISALLKASKTVLKHREFKISARAIFDSCKELLGATAGYVALLSDDGKDNIVLFLESGGLPCSVDPSLPMPVRGLRAETYNTGKVVVENDFLKSKWNELLPRGHVNLENVLFAPLTVNGRTVGIIGLANKPGGFTERDAQMALAFGEIASIALINSQMLEMLEENAKKLKAQSDHLEELVEERTKQLQDVEKLAAIGQTAGMVGHDIRNPLQSIIGDVYLAKRDLATLPDSEEKESLRESLEAIEKQTEYINKIVLDLQDFAKPLNPFAEETDIEKLISEMLLKNGIPENVQTEIEVGVDAKMVIADSAFMKRILGNLVSNAVQAMPKGGKLTIRTYREASDVVITVEDTGVGIPDEVKPKLFQPLFTTKAKGQGFGLAVVKRLTEALNGTITFESQEGKGTKFMLRFPSAPKNR